MLIRFTVLIVAFAAGCGKPNPFAPVPDCMGATVTPLAGQRQLLLSSLGIADSGQGFDLDGDGKIDNRLALLASVANSQVTTVFKSTRSIGIAIEMFGYTGTDAACTKLAFYLADLNKDRDNDGVNTSPSAHDCLDIDASIPAMGGEVMGDSVDNDCDGYADNPTVGSKPTADPRADQDGDGYTIAQGDCDDRNDTPEHLALAKTRHPGAIDICDDGIDQDCDGIPDNDASCNPFMQNNVPIDIVQTSFIDGAAAKQPQIVFGSGAVKAGKLTAGPSLFTVTLPIKGIDLTLQISGARISGDLTDANMLTNLANGLLGGVLEAQSLAQITGLSVSNVINADQTLLDAFFVGAAAPLIGLPTDKDNHYTADIDVDGDGLEAFWQEGTPTAGASPKVDTCKDGDGTIIRSMPGAPCALAKDAKGNYRFVDGISVALKYTAVPAKFNTTLVAK